MAIYPFNLITIDGGPREPARASSPPRRQWDKPGTQAWCGYSFSWMACLRARVGDAEAALRNLDIFTKAFILRNGFHANGDQLRAGYSRLHLPALHAGGQFPGRAGGARDVASKLEARPGSGDPAAIRMFPATPGVAQRVL